MTKKICALDYVKDQIEHLASIKLTPEGEHELLCMKVMLRQVWGLEYRDGLFVSAGNGLPAA